MKNVNIQTNKVLADAIIEQLRFMLIVNLDWLEFAFPAAKKAKSDKKSLPAVYNQDGTLQFITPNSIVKSLCFFEKKNYSISHTEDNNQYDLSAIFWVQLDKLRESEVSDFSDELIYQVSEVLINNRASNITVQTDSAVLNEFDFEDSLLMYPYAAFKVSFRMFGFKNKTNSSVNTLVSNNLAKAYLQKASFEAEENQSEFVCSFLLTNNCVVFVDGTQLEPAFYSINKNILTLINPLFQYQKLTVIN